MFFIIYNKLVRDKIPDIIKKNGQKPLIKILSDSEYRLELEKKLQEEVLEYLNSDGDMVEIADILEVLFSIIEDRGYTFDEVMNIKSKKFDSRGGFKEKIFLVASEHLN